MLSKFSVSNFKGFEKEFILDLNSNIYKFNKESIRDNIVNTSLIYGHNGVGKSNLAIAIFDIITHITDKFSDTSRYQNYLNAKNKDLFATFCYTFVFNDVVIEYSYKKSAHDKLIYEKLIIDGTNAVLLDKDQNILEINMEGAETVNYHPQRRWLSLGL